VLAKARLTIQTPEEVADQAGFYKLLGDPTRLRLLQALAATEMCVCDLAALLASSLSAVSHQLRLLRTAGLVRYRKEGKMVYYRLADARLAAVLLEGRQFMVQRM
jgi:DNA-binding transcriptional ArsR family regulator